MKNKAANQALQLTQFRSIFFLHEENKKVRASLGN
jgi:hypothetical protein